MPWQDRTITQNYDSLRVRIEQRLKAKNHLAQDASIADNSKFGVILLEVAGLFHDAYGHIQYRSKQIHADTAEKEFLDRKASEIGIVRKLATAATGTVDFTGTDGTSISLGTRLQAAAAPGVIYKTLADATIVVGAATAAIAADTTGIIGNLNAGDPMTLVVPIEGINPDVLVSPAGMTAGVDSENDDQLLDRYLFRKRNPPRGGKNSDYVNWMREVPGIVNAWATGTDPSRGYVTGRFIKDPLLGSPIPTEADRVAVLDYVNGHTNPITGQPDGRPIGMEFRSVILDELVVNFTIGLSDNSAAVRTKVEAEIRAQFLLDALPNGTLRVSRFSEAISRAAGENHHRMSVPAADVALGVNEYPIVGAFTWEAY